MCSVHYHSPYHGGTAALSVWGKWEGKREGEERGDSEGMQKTERRRERGRNRWRERESNIRSFLAMTIMCAKLNSISVHMTAGVMPTLQRVSTPSSLEIRNSALKALVYPLRSATGSL